MPNWKKLIVSGSDAALNSLNVTSALTASGLIYPTIDGDNGDFLTTDGIGNLSFSRPNVYANVKNVSGVQLLKGTPVHATGTAGNASEVIAASASVASTMPATFILNETLADDAEGLAILTGYLNGVNTSAFGEGDVVYVGPTGSFTNVKPQGSDNLIQNLGIVTKIDATNGSGYVYGSGRSNDVPNLPEGKVWVGSSEYTVTSSIVTLDETNFIAEITGSLEVQNSITGSTLQLTNPPTQASEATSLMIGASGNVGTRELGTNAFNSTAFTTCTGTVTGTGANNRVATWNGTTSLDSSANFTYDGTTLDLTYTGTGDLLRLTSTDAGASSAPDLTFCRNSASPADNDTLGTAQFWGKSTAADKLYAAIYGRIACATSGQTKGNISFKQECNNVFIDTANFSPYGLYVLPPSFNSMTTPGIGLTVTGGVSGSTTLQIGSGHSITGTLSSVAGGCNNTVVGSCGFIGGGLCNYVGANVITAPHVIGGGANNCVNAYNTSGIFGGVLNKIEPGFFTGNIFIGGGQNNQVTSSIDHGCLSSALIGGGGNNKICSCGNSSAILGGCTNTISKHCSVIGGGKSNCADGTLSGILGGTTNTVSHGCSFIIGSNLTSDKACYTFMNNLDVEGTVSASIFSGSFVGDGSGLTNISAGSVGAAGLNTQIQFNNSGVLGASGDLTWDGTTLDTNGNLDVAGTVRLGYTGTDPVIIGNPSGKRTEWNNPGYFEIYASSSTLGDNVYRETVDIDGDFFGGGFVGVYPADTDNRPGVQIWSGRDKGENHLLVYPFTPDGQTQYPQIYAAYISSSATHTSDINYTGSFIHLSGSYDNKIVIGTCVTDANVGSNNLYVVGDVAGTTKLTIGSGHLNTGTLSSIAGGATNCITGIYDFIGGGISNCICNAKCSSIVGGDRNVISGSASSRYHFIGGGLVNKICIPAGGPTGDSVGTIGGGYNNCLTVGGSTIAGGTSNTISGYEGFIGGGNANTVSGCYGSVVAGRFNCVSGCCSAVVNGCTNCVTANLTSIVGGTLNTGSGACGFIGGGEQNNLNSGIYSVIGGGNSNTVYGNAGVIVGGSSNSACGFCGFIGGGASNNICLGETFAVIGGGRQNIVDGDYSTIVGGWLNSVSSNYQFIGGGKENCINSISLCSTIVGGYQNCICSGCRNFIGGGADNAMIGSLGQNSVIVGGSSNIIDVSGTNCTNNFIGGGFSNCLKCINYSTITGGNNNCIFASSCSIIGGGTNNTITGKFNSTIGGGGSNTIITGCYAATAGGFANIISEACFSFIGAGNYNCICTCAHHGFIGTGFSNLINNCACYGGIVGGYNNTLTHCCSFIIGQNLSSGAVCYTHMNNACVFGTTRTTTLVETSARRFKECILPLQDQIENIKKLEPVEFQWKKDKTKDIGFIAEDVKEIFPDLVAYEEDGEISGVQYSKLTTVLVKALQQQQEQIDELKKEIFILKQQG